MIGQFAGKTKDLAYITGVYLGDGWMGYIKSNGIWAFRLNTIDIDFALKTRESIFNLTGKSGHICTHSVKKSSKPNNGLTVGVKELFFLIKDCVSKTKFPDFVKEFNREEKLALISGLLDSEGYVAISKYRPTNITIGLKATGQWMFELYDMCKDLGIKVGNIGKEVLKSGKTAIRFHFDAKSFIDNGCYFNIARKQERIKCWLLNPQRLYVEHGTPVKI